MTVAGRATLRAYRGAEDVPALVGIWNAMSEADGIPERRDVKQMTIWFRTPTPHFDASHDVIIAEVDGVPRGWVRHSWVDEGAGGRDHPVRVMVGPDDHDLMPLLQDAAEARAREVADAQGDLGRARTLTSFAMPSQQWRRDELERRGYDVVRWFF
ncbi:MAG: hypothetical protein ABI534_09230, partial [Chloroflexota bacterium]